MFQIYLIESLATLKKYVGQTSLPLRKRLQRHCWKSEDRKNMVITQAIAKYGKETFTVRKIDDARTLEEANKKEVYWCKFLNTMSPNGYNLRAGGRTYASHAPEVADKIARARFGKESKYPDSPASSGYSFGT